jgi:hypothetical protein
VVVATVRIRHCHYHTGVDEAEYVYIVLALSIMGGDEEQCDTVTVVDAAMSW